VLSQLEGIFIYIIRKKLDLNLKVLFFKRICDDEKRRLSVLKIIENDTLIQSLSLMIEINSENGIFCFE
jgi:hypothetical protein